MPPDLVINVLDLNLATAVAATLALRRHALVVVVVVIVVAAHHLLTHHVCPRHHSRGHHAGGHHARGHVPHHLAGVGHHYPIWRKRMHGCGRPCLGGDRNLDQLGLGRGRHLRLHRRPHVLALWSLHL